MILRVQDMSEKLVEVGMAACIYPHPSDSHFLHEYRPDFDGLSICHGPKALNHSACSHKLTWQQLRLTHP